MTTAIARLTTARQSVWVGFLLRRLVRFAVALLVLFTLAFLMIRLVPGDPVRTALGPTASAELVNERKAALGLDQPLADQYLDYARGVLRGDFGISLQTSEPVRSIIDARLPKTLQLVGLAFLLAVLVSIPAGVVVAVVTRRGRRRDVDLAFTGLTGLIAVVPEYVLGVGLVFVFAVSIPVFPVAGADTWDAYVLPTIALASAPTVFLARMIRIEMLRVLEAEYIRVAYSKRLPPWRVYLRHALPNALTAALTTGGLLLGSMIAGTVVVENVFAWPGLGTAVVESVQQKDYPLVQAIVILLGTVVLIVNVIVDLALAALDPRSILRRT